MDISKPVRWKAILLFILSIGSHLPAQLPHFHRYDMSNGLASDRVYDILQDAKGYLWFATEAGLSKFDGYSFSQITTDEGLPVNEVLKLQEDSKGRLWCMTFPGIPTYIEKGSITHSRKAKWLQKAEVSIYFQGFLEDKQGSVWLIAHSSMVFRLDMEKQEIQSFSPQELKGAPRGIWQDKDGQIWLIGGENIWKWNGQGFEFKQKMPRYQSQNFFQMPNGDPLGVGRTAIFDYKNGTQTVLFEDEALRGLATNHINRDRNGDIWISTSSGLFRYQQSNGSWQRKDHLFKGQFISRFYQDREGNYWVSPLGHGVFFFSSFNIPSIHTEDMQNHPFYCLEIDQQGHLIAGGYKNWGRVTGNKLELIPLSNMENNQGQVTQILAHPDGLTFLLYPGGLIRTARDGSMSYHDVSPKNISVGPRGSIFLSGKRNLIQFQATETLPANFNRDTAFANTHQIFSGRFFDIHYVPKHGYIGVGNDSLFLYNGETFVPFQHKLPQQAQFLRKLHTDPSGSFWLLLEGQGVAHYQQGKWHHIGAKEGLSSTLMFSIADGPNQSILIGTQKGLNIIQPEESGEYSIKVLDKFDGLPSNVIYDALYHNDSIWVATPTGLAGFNPEILPTYSYHPPIHFTRLQVNQREMPLDSNLVFSHHQNNITISFKGLSFRHEGQLVYRYRMVNQSESWNQTSFPQVDFPQLAPSQYQFEVQTLRRNGKPSQHKAILNFSIQAPFWATLWFKILCASILILCLILFFRIRVLSYNRDVVRELLQLLLKKIKPQAYIMIKSKGVTLRIPYSEILYIEAMGDYVKLFTVDKSHIIHSTLKNLANELPTSDFIRIHRSFLIHKNQVTGMVGKKAILIGETELPIGRTYKTRCMEVLSAHLSS